ncbi:glycosyltransferase family 2 protein [Dokdonella sp.]|uniref:glycosyltransferase family 2 protein n=1 Tax=Dokdonella sp. TaxID=2291710 RepID=UPI002F40952B
MPSDPAVPTPGGDLTSFVVVAADSGPLLEECVASVLAADAVVELVLVDNASGDGSIERVLGAHADDARMRLLRNPANLGFGPACNRGAAVARGDVFVFLNPDCIAPRDLATRLRAALATDPRLGVLGVQVTDPHGAPARGNRRREPTLRRAMVTLSGLSRLESRWPALQGVEAPAAEHDGLETVEAVSGACLVLPRAAFERVGGFDEGYFLHAEDLDLCRRVRDAGFRVAIDPRVRVAHAQGTSSRSRPLFVARHKHRSLWRYFTKFDPAARNPLLRAVVFAGIWAHFVAQAPLLALRGRRRAAR